MQSSYAKEIMSLYITLLRVVNEFTLFNHLTRMDIPACRMQTELWNYLILRHEGWEGNKEAKDGLMSFLASRCITHGSVMPGLGLKHLFLIHWKPHWLSSRRASDTLNLPSFATSRRSWVSCLSAGIAKWSSSGRFSNSDNSAFWKPESPEGREL